MAVNVNQIDQDNDNLRTKSNIQKERSNIQMSCVNTGTLNAGQLIPIMWKEVLPSEHVKIRIKTGLECQPFVSNLYSPISSHVNIAVVPIRLIFDKNGDEKKWENFITGGVDGNDKTIHPNESIIEMARRHDKNNPNLDYTIADYLGLPTNFTGTMPNWDTTEVSLLPIRTYNKIYNDLVRNADLENEIDLDQLNIQKSNRIRDYYTNARVYANRGTTPEVPTETSENIIQWWDKQAQEIKGTLKTIKLENDPVKGATFEATGVNSKGTPMAVYDNLKLNANDIKIKINDIYVSMAIMRLQINNARMQTRYSVHLYNRWDVKEQDARLQLAEYINGDMSYINIATVTQTSEGTKTKQGNRTSQGTNETEVYGEYTAKEHCIIMATLTVKVQTSYEGGIGKEWTREVKEDYYTPELANLPDEAILGQELYYIPETNNHNKTIFGYTDRYQSYRTMTNKTTSGLRYQHNLNSYVLSRYWKRQNLPAYNKEFVQNADGMLNSIKQYTNEPDAIYLAAIKLETNTPMAIQSNPYALDFV